MVSRAPVCVHLCSHIGYTGPGEPPEDCEMSEMTLSSRHRIRNSSPGGLRPSTLPFGHGGSPQYWLSHVDGEETALYMHNSNDKHPTRPNSNPVPLRRASKTVVSPINYRQRTCVLSVPHTPPLWNVETFQQVKTSLSAGNLNPSSIH